MNIRPILNIAFLQSPADPKPWFIVEHYLTSEGVRSRICSGRFATKEDAEARRDELEAMVTSR